MSGEEIRKYFDIYTDCWRLFKKYAELMECLGSDDFWAAYLNDNAELFEKYGFHPYVKAQLSIATKELERIFKRSAVNEFV